MGRNMKGNVINITRGANRKPVASDTLAQALEKQALSGECFFGYPLIATPEGKYSIDATLISPTKGVILFDLVEGTTIGRYEERQEAHMKELLQKME